LRLRGKNLKNRINCFLLLLRDDLMDVLTAILYIVLFIVLMLFVFSMGLLTPIVGNKDIISVLTIGFIVGLVGGAFFITPIYQEIPYVVGSIEKTFTGTNERLNIEVSPIVDLNKLLKDLNKTEGVVSVANKGVVIKTDPFSNSRKKNIEDKLLIVDKNFKNFSVNETGVISISITDGHNPHDAIKTLGDWLMYTGGINIKYSLIHIQIEVKPSNVDDIVKFLNSENIVVTSIEGPVENSINNTKNIMLDNNFVIVLSGFFGVIIALISIFIDDIRPVVNRFVDKIKKIILEKL